MPLYRQFFRFVLMAVLLVVGRDAANLSAQEPKLPEDLKDLNLEAFGIKPVVAQKDPKTGFIIGGKNSADLIRSLTEINGRSIAQLEALMRPQQGSDSEETSTAGFLGPTESLLDILAEDNRYVVDELQLTHQGLALPLRVMGAAGGYEDRPQQFRYHGRRFEVRTISYKGFQFSPFGDRTSTSQDAVVKNLENGQEIGYSLLVPQMIERYGFYEGKATKYRVEPRQIVAVFDFLKKPTQMFDAAPIADEILFHVKSNAPAERMPRWRMIALTAFAVAVITSIVLLELRYRRSKPR
jgi:hypothetical protein